MAGYRRRGRRHDVGRSAAKGVRRHEIDDLTACSTLKMEDKMYITWQSIVTAGAVITAIVAIVKYYNRGLHWVDRQNAQDADIKLLKDEQTLLTYGVLACLKGLKEKGCNGPVTAAIDKIEKHLNIEAHK
nr:MAG TPA: hypothetical protein [Caudoviricetes sp.]